MNTTPVREVMSSAPKLAVEVEARPSLELLIGLSAATSQGETHDKSWVLAPDQWSEELRAAVGEAGERSGEAWLHLLGLALELPTADAQTFVESVARLEAVELRRHLVGVYVPAWVSLVGARTLERAAAGDGKAIAKLLAHPRYYAGRAGDALHALLSVSPKETKRRLVTVLRNFADEVFSPREQEIMVPIVRAAEITRELASTPATPQALIANVTRGYLYDPEPEFDRVVLVPHVGARPLLLLCQHRDARVICYPIAREQLDPEKSLAEQTVLLGRALGDPRRVSILRRLADGDATLDELAESAGLAKSTAHHHLARLRAAGLVALRGNARGYWYALRAQGLAEAQLALGELVHAPPEKASAPPKRQHTAGRPPATASQRSSPRTEQI
jgi:DNA-binding transcriptional ArsR family regulator